jgi:hypothetical protein
VYYTVRVLVNGFNDDDDKHVEHATLFHAFRRTPDNTDFNDEDLFIAPTTRQNQPRQPPPRVHFTTDYRQARRND